MVRFWLKRRLTGRSLIELLITSFIFGLLSLVVVLLLRNTLYIVRKHEVLLALQKEALVASSWFNADLAASSTETFADATGAAGGGTGEYAVTDGPIGPGVVFASPQGTDGSVQLDASGKLLWQKVVAYYLTPVNGVPCLVRKTLPITPTNQRPTLPTVSDMHSNGTAESRVIARHVVKFLGDPDLATPDPEPPYEFTFICRREGVAGYGIEISNSVFFRN